VSKAAVIAMCRYVPAGGYGERVIADGKKSLSMDFHLSCIMLMTQTVGVCAEVAIVVASCLARTYLVLTYVLGVHYSYSSCRRVGPIYIYIYIYIYIL